MKRNIALTMCVLMLAAAFFGCAQKTKSPLSKSDPVSVTIWHYYNGLQQQVFDNMVRKFNETIGLDEGIVVEAFSQGNVNDLAGEVLDAVNKVVGAQAVPDVFAAYADTAYEVNSMGLLADIGTYLTEEERAEYIDAYIEEGIFDDDGALKIFPIAKSTEVLMVNNTEFEAFKDETGADDKLLSTWEGLVKLGEMYYEWTDEKTEGINNGKAFFGLDSFANYMLIGSLQLGVELFDVQNGVVSYQIDHDVMRTLWDNFYVPYVNGWFGAYGRFRSDDVKTGSIIALLGSTSASSYFPEVVTNDDGTSEKIEALVAAMPCFEEGEKVAVQQGAGMAIVKSDYRTEYAAARFLKWFTQEQQNVNFSVMSGYLPVKKAANSHELLDDVVKNSENMITDIVSKSIYIGIDMSKEYRFYTNAAFKNGGNARNVVEYNLKDKARQDFAEISAKIAAGMSKEDAIEPYLSDAAFEKWLSDFSEALNACK